jgi:phage head maturation protease
VTIITAVFPGGQLLAAAVDGRRTITGTAVPWNVPGVVASGDTVVFHPGSLDPAERPVLLRDHDRARPIGRVVDAADTGDRLDASARISETGDGNDALVLAADGALPMLSVGADPIDSRYDDAGVLHVYRAAWRELSLLSIGAYPSARVSSVTATQGSPPMPDLLTTPAAVDTPVEPDPEPVEPVEPDPAEPELGLGEPVETVQAAAAVPLATLRRPGRAPARHPYADVDIRRLSQFIAAAQGDPRFGQLVARIVTSPGARAGSIIEAALTDVTLVGTNNIGPAHRPAYQAELVEIVSHGSPLVDAIRQGDLERGDYPNKTFNRWTATPQVALQTAEKVAINSTPVKIEPAAVPVQTWATGNDVSQQVLDFGSPSFIEDYIRAAGVDYADVIETYAATALLAAATDVPSLADATFMEIVGGLVGGLDPTKVPAGGLFLAVAWDAWVGMIGTKQTDGPAFWEGSISFGSMLPNADAGGLSIFYSPGMPASTYLMGLRNAATWYDLPGTPFSLRAINVGQLGLDLAVYGYGAAGVQFPQALVKTTVPAGP